MCTLGGGRQLSPLHMGGRSMASVEKKSYGFRIVFRFGGQKFHRSLQTEDEAEAESALGRLEDNIRLVRRGRLVIPDGADVPTFLLSDGKLNELPKAAKTLTLAELFDQYFASLPRGALEQNSLYTAQIHRKHFERILGRRFGIRDLKKRDLQRYIAKRSEEKTRKGTVGPATIRKELSTLRTVWTFTELGSFPSKGLKFPKAQEKPPFQTWKEIERQIAGGASEELWESLFLTVGEVDEVLDHVHETAPWPFIYPMLAMAAHTGARRSELLRSMRSDFSSEKVIIREKKRIREKYTTRAVPLTSQLRSIMDDWFSIHDAESTFGTLTIDQSNHYFTSAFTGRWSNIRGWHTFRHSFASNCAAAAVDQRMINAWMGHQTEEMMRRYQHLFPDDQHTAIQSVFN